MYFVSIKVLDFGEKSWKSPGIKQAKVLEKQEKCPGKSWEVLEFGLCFSVATLFITSRSLHACFRLRGGLILVFKTSYGPKLGCNWLCGLQGWVSDPKTN